jgi:uncharacterized protein YegL
MSKPRTVWYSILLAFVFVSAGLLLAEPAPLTKPTVVNNPDLQASCGLDVILVLDESGSISGSSVTAVRNAAQAFVSGLLNTGSRLAIVEFNAVARRPIGYTLVTPANQQQVFLPYLFATAPGGHAANYDPAQSSGVPPTTNWDDALEEVKLINFNEGFAPLVVFITDGEPTAYNLDADGEAGGFVSSGGSQSVWRAIIEANAVKNQGSHILAVGINLGLSGLAKLMDVSGGDIYSSGSLNLITTDMMVVSNFAALQTELAKVAVQLCQSSLVINKQVNVGNGTGFVPAAGWQFNTSVSVSGLNPANYNWVLPEPVPPPGSLTHTGVTGPAGSVTFQWKPNANISSAFTVTEVQQPGYVLSNITCTVRKENGTQQPLVINRNGNTFSTNAGAVAPQDFVTCTVQNGVVNVAVQKTVGTSAQGPWLDTVSLPPQSPVWWRIDVTNNGGAPLQTLSINDIPFTNFASLCATPPPSTLNIGATYTCIFQTTTSFQNITNRVIVQGCHTGVCKTAEDTASYTIITGALNVSKQVNWNGMQPDTNKTFEICIQGASFPTTPNCKSVGFQGGSLIWTGLIPGTYTVTETNPGAEWESIIGGSPVQVTTQGSTAAVTNIYRRGKLSIEKQVDWNGITPNPAQTFEICITGPSYPTGTCQSVDYDGGVVTWSDLVPGQYTVSETDPGANWFTSIQQSPVTVTTDGGSTMIQNVHRRGSLTVTKTVDWKGHEPNLAQGFIICIQGASYPEPNCQTASALGGDLVWNELIPGDYMVSEINPGADWISAINASPVTVTVQGSTASVSNTYAPIVIPECNESNRDPRADLQRSLWPNAARTEVIATVTNTSEVCAYEVALVAYQKYDETLDTQVPFSWAPALGDLATFMGGVDGTSIILQPGETRTLSVPLPACAAQVDLVFDADHLHPLYADAATDSLNTIPLVLPAFQTGLYGALGNSYGQRLLAVNHTNQIDSNIPYCAAP